ncbi:MAG: hypothetical protein OEN22_00600 [Gammaproteobacteria bacterium]|nr:hypothetical protein [Gammaproteobacteria bacterium]
MRIATRLMIASSLLLIGISSPAIADATDDSLFASHEPLEIRLEAPFDRIIEERPEDEDIPGLLRYTESDGNIVELDVGIRTRGKFRRREEVCRFPPLRLNFRKSQTDDSVFDKQDRLKLVTHCNSASASYEQLVLAEYLAYRILNSLTDVSYRVRLIRMTYAYTDTDRESVKYAFLIEHADRMAKRVDKPHVTIEKARIADLEPEYTNLTSVFQFLIGNTDFSPIAAATGEDCCHNHTLFGKEGEVYYSVPYDFDQSGIVDAPYAGPNPRFRMRSVRQRLYRGRCRNNGLLPATLQRFRERRETIEALIDAQPELSTKLRGKTRSYVTSFYKIIDNPKRVERLLVKKCV